MNRLYAPTGLFAAVAMTCKDDPDLPDGAHVRVLPSPLLGFPIAPVELFKVPAEPRFVEEVLWRDRDGNQLAAGDLDDAGGYLTAEWAPQREGVDVAVQLESDRTFQGTVSLLDPVGDRVLARASAEPFQVAGPRVSRLRIEGSASRVDITAWSVSNSMVLEKILGGEVVDRLSLPVDGGRTWYAGGLGIDHNFDVVRRGAPQRTTPADDPDGGPFTVGQEDEFLRVSAFLDSTMQRVEVMLSDPEVHPSRARVPLEAADDGEPRQLVDISACSTLLAQAMDPGHGRLLGLVTSFDEVDREPHAYVAAGLFAVDSHVRLSGGVSVAGALPDLTDLTDRLIDRNEAREIVDTIASTWRDDVVVRPLVAVAGAPIAPDRPTMPEPSLGRSRWLEAGGEMSQQFSQEIEVDEAPLAALVALGRRYDGTWATAHQQVELPPPAEPSLRAVAMLMGRTGERAPLIPRGLITNSPVDVGGDTRYRIRLADLFGRFGAAAEIDVPDPGRPLPPAPAPQVKVVLDGPDGDDDGTLVSPGRVVVTVPVPPVGDLVVGSVPIAALRTVLDGDEILLSVHGGAGGATMTTEHEHGIRQLSQGEVFESTVQAAFVDELGREGPVISATVRANDRRRPPTVVTGRGIIWTSRAGPSPEVELRLTWPAPAGTGYRAYVADATSLGLSGATRADVARHGTELDRDAGLGSRDRYRLLNDVPLTPVNGRVTMNELFPRSLHSVQFLRVVPVSDLGREATFESCRAIPVAVPTDRRPPAPRVRATVDRDGSGATVVVEAVGLDLVALRAAEPGLFTDPPDADAAAPEFRVRRAMSPVSDPVYAPEVGRGRLVRVESEAGPVFTATFEDPSPVPPYVRVSYWAEVRMPPERRLPRDVAVELPPAGGVTPVDPSQFEPMPAPYSRPSAPSTVTGPADTAAHTLGSADATVGVDAGMAVMTLSATTTPVAHSLAPHGFTLRLWERWGSGDLTSAGPDLPLTGGPLEWTGVARPDPGDQPTALVYTVVAPDGTAGPQRELPADRETWESLGGQFISAPAVCSPANLQLAVLGIGTDSLTYERRFDGQTWGPGWNPISTTVATSAPICTASGNDGTVLLATFRDESPILFRRAAGAWMLAPPGPITSARAMVVLGNGHVRQFGVWLSGVHESTWDGAAWSGAQRLPGPGPAALEVAALATGAEVDLVVRARDGSVHHRQRTGGAWGTWRRIGAFSASAGPAIGRLNPVDLAVVARGQDGRLYWTRLRPEGEAPWTRISAVPVVGAPAVTSTATRLDIVVQRTDGRYYHRWYDGDWHA